ncbi:MAG: PVC-type heme-binding CxxCH protein [Verrucomicrobiota bacterium]
MNTPTLAAFVFALLSVAGLSAQNKEPVAKIVLPPEPVAQAVTKKINVLDLFREGKAEMHINPKADIHDDAKNVFKFDDDGLFHISGNGYGGITTNDSFKDYHLVIEFKWGDKTWGKRAKATRDNGILVHCYGPQGAVGGSWMASIEAQIIEGGVGDILVLAPKLADGTVLETSLSAEVGLDRDKEKIWTPGAPRQTMKTGRLNWQKRDVDWKDTIGFRGKDDVESPFGQWTRFEVIAKGDTLQYLVNGVKVNEAFECKPSQGRILLQVEAAEMFVRRYELYPLGGFKEKWSVAKPAAPAHGDAEVIPAYAARPPVMDLSKEPVAQTSPKYKLPRGFEMVVAATSPMVANPTMGCVDDQGRLFVGDSAGVNWSPKKFETERPNRILLLEDRDGDGIYEHSTVFADKLAYPKGAYFLNGSLYVTDTPGVWKFTDTDGDGIADKRELMVGGFQWTANSADCHGPRLHPDGRLYWTHGRKGHDIKQKDGTPVHEGLNSGIWSMKPDGSDIRWHALGCADNPTGLDFTPTGELIGTTNLYFGSPRVDTLMQWQIGGVYERPDFLRIIENLPRTHERMPILRELGHMVPSGCAFWKNANKFAMDDQPWAADPTNLQLMVTMYNSQKLLRYEMQKEGATYRTTEHEFFTVDRKGAHLTDVMEDIDGSLIVFDTGTWYSHCPSSLQGSANVPGMIYRLRRTAEGKADHLAVRVAHKPLVMDQPKSDAELLTQLSSADQAEVRRGLEGLTFREAKSPAITEAIRGLLSREADAVLEHALLTAGMRLAGFTAEDLTATKGNLAQARLLRIISQSRAKDADYPEILKFAVSQTAAEDATLARNAYLALIKAPDAAKLLAPVFVGWLKSDAPSSAQVAALEKFSAVLAGKSEVAKVIATMLGHAKPLVQQAALRAVAAQAGKVDAKAWARPLDTMLSKGASPLLLDAIARVKDKRYDVPLNAIAADITKPSTLRLKALLALSGTGNALSEPAFRLLSELLVDPASPGLRMDAATRLANTQLTAEQWEAYLAILPTTGPLEQSELLVALALPQNYKNVNLALGKKIASAYSKSPLLGTFSPDLVRKAFGFLPRDVYEILEPAFDAALVVNETKKERMGALALAAVKQGDAATGRRNFEAGKGACIACHKIGNVGNEVGPNLSKIGGIRVERELIESILFPSNSIARDYDLNSFQMSDGTSVLGLIKGRSAEGVTIVEASGQKRLLTQESIASSTQLTTSLMPAGLDAMFTEQELLDLVAFLRSLK